MKGQLLLFLQVAGVEGVYEVHEFLLFVDVELGVDAFGVGTNGVFRHHQILGRASYGVAARNVLHDLGFAGA